MKVVESLKKIKKARFLGSLSILLGLMLLPTNSHAAEQTQTLDLRRDWTAIWLQVAPKDADGLPALVEDVFTDSRIEKVLRLDKPVGTADFVDTDTDDITINQEEWKVWDRNSPLVNTLNRITGNTAYLIMNNTDDSFTFDVTGDVEFFTPNWVPDSYNFVGFNLSTDTMTFDELFGASDGRHLTTNAPIYRMRRNGNWREISGTDTMDAGRAYLVYSDGPSDYVGPVAINFDGISAINFGDGPGNEEIPDPQGATSEDTISVTLEELVLTNVSDSAQTVSLEKTIPASGGSGLGDDLRIFEVIPNPTSLGFDSNGLIVDQAIGPIPANSTEIVTLGADRNWTTGAAERENLYRLEIGDLYFWLPMSAKNPDLDVAGTGNTDPNFQGLWVGEVTFNEVTSFTDTDGGRPVEPTTSSAPMRVIVHVDSSGTPSLLSHVMFMQTKTADDTVVPEQVLLVDEEKIPFFEGIEERNDKKVGKRIESVGYDMPRKIDITTQADLLQEVVDADPNDAIDETADVTDADLENYINSRTSRPIDLVEDYHLTWPLAGGLGPGVSVTTTSSTEGPLLFDPFHRSNPFRHAFHPQHVAGFAVSRDITIRFDDDSKAGLLTGTYEETVDGLASAAIVARGPIRLQRVSEVGTLE